MRKWAWTRRGLSDGLYENFHHRKTSTSIRAAPRRVLESLIHTLNYEEPLTALMLCEFHRSRACSRLPIGAASASVRHDCGGASTVESVTSPFAPSLPIPTTRFPTSLIKNEQE